MSQSKHATSRLVSGAMFLTVCFGLVGCAGSQRDEAAPSLQEPQSDLPLGAGEGDTTGGQPTNPLLGHALASGNGGSELNGKRIGRAPAPRSGKATSRPRASRPSAKGQSAKSRGSRSKAAESRNQRRARRRQTAKRVFAGAAIVAVAAAASANSANSSRGSSGGSSSGSSSGGGGEVSVSYDPNPTNDAYLPGGDSYSNGAAVY